MSKKKKWILLISLAVILSPFIIIVGLLTYVWWTMPNCPDRCPPLIQPRAVASTPYTQYQAHTALNGRYVRIRYTDEGGGENTIGVKLGLPGLIGRVEEHIALTEILTNAGERFISLDIPGSGYSTKPNMAYSMVDFEDAVIEFVRVKKLKPPITLIGGSLGGNLGVRLLRRRPDLFTEAVVWSMGSVWQADDPVTMFPPAGMRPAVELMEYESWIELASWSLKWMREKIVSLITIGQLGWVVKNLVQDTWLDEVGFWVTVPLQLDTAGAKGANKSGVMDYIREVYCRGFVRMYWGMVEGQLNSSLMDIAGEIKQPILIMGGTKDYGLGIGEGVRKVHSIMMKNNPKAEVLIVEAGHNVFDGKADVVVPAMLKFLKKSN